MEKFTHLTAIAAPLDILNIDTDMIIPKQFLKTIKRTGLGQYLFNDMRTNSDGNINQDFILNQEAYKNSKILVTAANFGCGSSREHAPWALTDFGIRCVIAPSFADIFYNNCFENGILPAIISQENQEKIMVFLAEHHNQTISIDLPKQNITFGYHIISFEIDDFRKQRLLEGLDSISLSLKHSSDIENYEKQRAQKMPWLATTNH